MGLYKSRTLLYMLLANALVIVLGPFLLYSIDAEIYRLFAPHIGRMLTTVFQAVFSIAAGLLWIYLWRKSFVLYFERLLKQRSDVRRNT